MGTAVRGAYIAALLIAASVGMLAACSNKQVYEAVQQANIQECQKNHKSARERCIEQVSQPYEDYQRSRQAAMQDRN